MGRQGVFINRYLCSIWLGWLLLLGNSLGHYQSVAQAAPIEDDDSDGYVLLQAEDPSMPVSTWASQVGQDLSDCVELPIPGKGWASCKLAPAAVAAPAAASRVIDTLKTLEGMTLPRSAAGVTVGSLTVKRRLFKRVGRSKRVRLAIRHLHQDEDTAAALVTAAAADPGAEPAECPNGNCPSMWGMNRIEAPAVWAELGSKGLLPLASLKRKISIIDTGADVANRNVGNQFDKENSITYTLDYQQSADSEGGLGGISNHGSHVFCTVAGAWGGNDPTGIAGVLGPAPGGVVSCNVFGHNGDRADATVSDIVRCVSHVRSKSAHWVVNLSLGGEWDRNGTTANLLKDAFNTHICDQGGIIVVAAHNYMKNVDDPQNPKATYPAAFAGTDVPCLIAVASIEQGDTLSSFSNYGNKVRIAAPGSNVVSCGNSNGGSAPWATTELSGTSMASPHVAGAAALLMNVFPKATNYEVIKCLLSTATGAVTYNNPAVSINGGILDVKAAYTCVSALYLAEVPAGPDCTKQSVPPCVEAATGTIVNSCKASNNTYCLSVGSSTCSYRLSKRGSVCNAATSATCTGTSPTCPKGQQGQQTPGACKSDPIWSCELPGLCETADGCRCSDSKRRRSAGLGCICSAPKGFVPITLDDGTFKCRWNITWKGYRFVTVPLNSNRAVLPITIGPDGRCPPAGVNMISTVTINEIVECPVKVVDLVATSEPAGESCGKYVMSTAREGATVGACYRLNVATTDRRSYNLVLQYR